MRARTLVAGLALATSVALTGCSEDSAEQESVGGGGASAEADFNDADVTFAQSMIPHHQQAVEMAQMAEEQAESDDVRDLAADIMGAQGPEIELMTEWLEAWGADVPSGSLEHGEMDHGTEHEMPGMMDEEQMTELAGAEGTEWDELFLEMMVEHHEGAVEMAQTELDEGQNPEALALAEDIISTQQAEIDTMQELLGG